MAEGIPRDFAGFVSRFATEAACRSYLASLRWPEGFVCVACGHRKGWPTARGTVFCASCRRQTSPTAGTVLHGSRVPLRKWFLAMQRACTEETGLSPKALQRELELGSYQTAWLMVRRLRQAMGGVARERLRGKIEVDEVLVGRPGDRAVSGAPAESARTAQGLLGVSNTEPAKEGVTGQALVAIAVELPGRKAGRVASGSARAATRRGRVASGSARAATRRGRVASGSAGAATRHGSIRLRHVPDASSEVLVYLVAECVEGSSVVITDGWRGYRGLGELGLRHRVRHTAGDDEPGADVLPQVRPVASGLEAWLAAAYRPRAGHAHLQGYLDEFAFGWNWRRSQGVGEAFRRLAEELVGPGPAPDLEPPESRGASGRGP